MRTNGPKPDPGVKGPNILHEADIGSGERSPAQHETDAMIRDIPARGQHGSQQSDQGGQSGSQQGGDKGQSAKK